MAEIKVTERPVTPRVRQVAPNPKQLAAGTVEAPVEKVVDMVDGEDLSHLSDQARAEVLMGRAALDTFAGRKQREHAAGKKAQAAFERRAEFVSRNGEDAEVVQPPAAPAKADVSF